MEHTYHPVEYLRVLKRRRIWFIGPFAAVVLIGLLLAWLLPATYRSSATIAVQAPALTPELVPATAPLDIEERLRALSQQLRSPEVLERVAREEGLANGQPLDEVVNGLRQGVSVEVPKPIARDARAPQLNAFDIVYRDGSAERTQKIADRLARVFVEEHSRTREAQAEGAAAFLASQLRASQVRIAELEQRLRGAKEVNMGRLPEQTAANLQTLGGLRQQLEATSNTLRSEQDRLALLERNIQAVRQGAYASGAGMAPVGSARILALQRDLAVARGKYTEKHPEIQHLEQELAAARADLAASKNKPAAEREDVMTADPAFQQLDAERNLVIIRIAGLRRSEGQLRADIGRYQQRVEMAPMVEQELASVQREYDLEKENYKQLSTKHGAALVQEQIQRGHGGERFSVLYSAYLPESPESPKRGRLMLMALAFGLLLGGGAAFGREYLDRSVRDARVLQEELQLPVLAEIPRIGRGLGVGTRTT
jgi:succinoglycan biosynthesis transport protein ExoP